ncbi:ArsR family transcriptional regulator [Deinococcus hopiensis]|uniref:Predicted transcriptional regulators n=1 Tax=Deinococcus hopiensis KR-140 TaxID=695939 RepID=A0A1W1UXN9_9DEIO|nr:ArsR family transcriptional regulator [Deinococcus hopiensis]SMB85541.1 Predicted transcriptional regulators [Deinococcus hopiensis KR-140]
MKFQRILTTHEELRIFADPVRLMLFRLLISREATLTQLARALGLKPNLVHYHLKKLLAIELVQTVRHDDEGKYYRATFLNVGVAPDLRFSDEADPSALAPEQPPAIDPDAINDRNQAHHGLLNLTDEQQRTLLSEINALLERYQNSQTSQGIPRAVTIALVALPGTRTPTDIAEGTP